MNLKEKKRLNEVSAHGIDTWSIYGVVCGGRLQFYLETGKHNVIIQHYSTIKCDGFFSNTGE